MTFFKTMVPIFAALIATAVIQVPASAHQNGGRRGVALTQQANNMRGAADLRARFDLIDARIAAAQRNGRITSIRTTALHRQIAQARTSMTRLSRRQGFVSAAEFASYERTLDTVDAELNDQAVEPHYGKDALPSAEVIAFQVVDARLGYRNARIEQDGRGCAVYRGTAANGAVQDEPLLASNGQPICIRR